MEVIGGKDRSKKTAKLNVKQEADIGPESETKRRGGEPKEETGMVILSMLGGTSNWKEKLVASRKGGGGGGNIWSAFITPINIDRKERKGVGHRKRKGKISCMIV